MHSATQNLSIPRGEPGETPNRDTSPDQGLSRQVKVVAGVVVLGVIMSVLDTTIVNVALDTLSRELHSPLSTIQWVSTGYLLSLAMVIPLAGWLSERFGSKRVWMISVAVFAVGSALCGTASSAGSLIFFRVLQGFGGGLIMPVVITVITQKARPQRMGRVMGIFGVLTFIAPAVGPVIGGWFALPSVVAILMALDRRWSAIRITLQSQLIGLALMLVAVVRAWTDFDQSNWLTWVFVGGIATMFLGLLALDVAMDSRFRAYKRMIATPR